MYNNRGRGRFNKNNCESNPQIRFNSNSCSLYGNRYKLAVIIVTDLWFVFNLTLMLNAMGIDAPGNPRDYLYPFSIGAESGFWTYDFSELIIYGVAIPLLAQIGFIIFSLRNSLSRQSAVASILTIVFCVLSFGLVTPIEDIALRSQYITILSIITILMIILIVADMVYFRSRYNE